MHKFMLNFFSFLKSSAYFLKIVTIFCILCLLLYWTQNLAGFNWSWLNFIKPLLDSFLETGYAISQDEVYIFNAVFEYKYGIAILLFFAIYFIAQGLQILFQTLENLYSAGRRLVKKIQEDKYNKALSEQNIAQQEQIKNYQIYVAAYTKKKTGYLSTPVDIEKQTKEMNKFLMKQTGINPIKYGEGFLYSFNDFNYIDNVLPHFFKLIKSNAPLDYIICIQVLPKSITNEFENLKKLINLKLYNKVTTLADTVWRYKFNKSHRYEAIQIGLYQSGSDSFEAHEFVEIL